MTDEKSPGSRIYPRLYQSHLLLKNIAPKVWAVSYHEVKNCKLFEISYWCAWNGDKMFYMNQSIVYSLFCDLNIHELCLFDTSTYWQRSRSDKKIEISSASVMCETWFESILTSIFIPGTRGLVEVQGQGLEVIHWWLWGLLAKLLVIVLLKFNRWMQFQKTKFYWQGLL